MNLDVRDFEFWAGESSRELARQKLNSIRCVSVPWMQEADRNEVLETLHEHAYTVEEREQAKKAQREADEKTWAKGRAKLKTFLKRRN